MKTVDLKKLRTFVGVFLLVVTSSLITARVCYWIAEHYYFDKFFYQKSAAHGYWVFEDSSYHRLTMFGKRAEDMLALEKYIYEQKDPQSLQTTAKNEFTIAVFGDSFVWGDGVLESESFPYILKKKLNEYRPTRVLVFAIGGDNIIDQWRKYNAFLNTGAKADLFIFGIVHNDAFLKSNSWYGMAGQDFLDQCGGEIVQDPSDDPRQFDMNVVYPQRVKESLIPGTRNFCLTEKLIPTFPKEHAMYLDLDSLLTTKPDYKVMSELYRKAGFPMLTFHTIAPEQSPEQEKMYVSKAERHPSRIAHQVYAQAIISTLLHDKRFGFIER